MTDQNAIKGIPVFRMYFAVQCPLGTPAASILEASRFTLNSCDKAVLYLRSFHGRGSSVCQPFAAIELGFELHEYVLDVFEHCTNRLFEALENNREQVIELKSNAEIATQFVVNQNSMDAEQRPVFFLSPPQVALLALFGSSVSLDGYLMFGNGGCGD